jgi:hypothetical protein
MAKRRRGKQRQINLELNESELLREWKKRVGVELYKFAQRNFPLNRKMTGKDLYVDSDTLVNAIILRGTVPNAADIKGFSAPVNQRVPAKPHPVNVYGHWKTVSTKTKVGRMGIYERPTEYYGGKRIELGYYGVKVGSNITAYGLTSNGDALPAYSYDVVTWLADEQSDEVKRILDECFAEVFGHQRQTA